MVSARVATAVVGVAISLLISLAAWVYFDTLLLFLLVPFVPFLFRGRGTDPAADPRRCPTCGFEARDSAYQFCPHDGTPLE